MKLSVRIFLGYFFIVGVGTYFMLNTVMDELKPVVRQSMEDTLVDTANLLAEVIQQQLKNGLIDTTAFARAVQGLANRKLNARIWGFNKESANHRIYVTDAKGVVIFDSTGLALGQDYSRWNDVYLTLRGEYGVRTTRADPNNELSSVMHVAAPLKDGEQIIGVVTVAKPNLSVQPFIDLSRQKMVKGGIVLIVLSLAFGWFFSWRFSRAISRLATYAREVSLGKRVVLPATGSAELAMLGQSIEIMRNELEGKDDLERYVQTLAHEIKSPLAAISGALELLDERMPETERAKFIANLQSESLRIHHIVERLLDLARVEHRQALESVEEIDIPALVEETLASKSAAIYAKNIRMERELNPMVVRGERFLLRQALSNLVDNAVAFCGPGDFLRVMTKSEKNQCQIAVSNSGAAIPEFALPRVFERFYSLPRPDTGLKSTGLGLPFVREVAELHQGTIEIKNQADWVTAVLILPCLR